MVCKRSLLVSLVSVTLVAQSASANRIYSPVGITQNTMGEFSSEFLMSNAINRSGLSASFDSGVTDFNTYMSAGPGHTSDLRGTGWGSVANVTSGMVDFDLGQPLFIQQLAIWPDDRHGPARFTVFTADNPTFTNAIDVGTFTTNPIPGGPPLVPAWVFELSDSTNRFVRIQVESSLSPNQIVAWGEVAFNAMMVPEPSSTLLCAAGFLAAIRRRADTSRARG